MKNLLIVGTTSGIGEALCESLLSTHNLWTAGRHAAGHRESVHIAWDAAAEFPAEALPDRLDGLVYCPGTIRLQPFDRLPEAAYREDFELNLLGAVRAIKAALPALKSADRASVVLFSTVAVSTGLPMHASIAAAKGAVEGLTRSLAAEFAPRIRFNAVAPSLTETPLASGLLKTERLQAAAADRHPLGRFGQPEDVAAAARYLLSDDSAWVTGHVLPVDGGMSTVRRFN